METYQILCLITYILSVIITCIMCFKEIKNNEDPLFFLFFIFCPILNTSCIIFLIITNIYQNLKQNKNP